MRGRGELARNLRQAEPKVRLTGDTHGKETVGSTFVLEDRLGELYTMETTRVNKRCVSVNRKSETYLFRHDTSTVTHRHRFNTSSDTDIDLTSSDLKGDVVDSDQTGGTLSVDSCDRRSRRETSYIPTSSSVLIPLDKLRRITYQPTEPS